MPCARVSRARSRKPPARSALRRARYRGLARTHLQNVATAAALDLDRIAAWLHGRPLARTRTSRFAALAA
jgi:hypothetical protein